MAQGGWSAWGWGAKLALVGGLVAGPVGAAVGGVVGTYIDVRQRRQPQGKFAPLCVTSISFCGYSST